jgi:Domain of unknown function (DUF4189)
MRLPVGLAAVLCCLLLQTSVALGEAAVVKGDRGNGAYGHSFSFGRATQREATQEALSNCATYSRNCVIVRQFNSMCFALAYSQTGGWGFDFRNSLPEAEQAAIAQCQAHGRSSQCHVVRSFCDSVSEQTIRAQQEAQRLREAREEGRRMAEGSAPNWLPANPSDNTKTMTVLVAALLLAIGVILKVDLSKSAKVVIAIAVPTLASVTLYVLGIKTDYTLVSIPIAGGFAAALIYSMSA